jgi:hypothetical protein
MMGAGYDALNTIIVMAAPEAAIQQVRVRAPKKLWMAGSSPAMTKKG